MIGGTAEALDWPSLVTALEEGALTSLGRARIQKMAPLPDVKAIRLAHEAVAEVLLLQDEGMSLPLGGVSDVSDFMNRASRGEMLNINEIREVANTLEALRSVELRGAMVEDVAPRLSELTCLIIVDDALADEVASAFTPDGQVCGRRYPEVGRLRQAVAELHSSMRTTLDEMVRGEQFRDLLQDSYWTIRNGRYVLPIKSHAKRWDIGIVHGASGSGQTVYIEPSAILQLNNRLAVAQSQLQSEERRVLIQLSRAIGYRAQETNDALQIIAELDSHIARADLAVRLGATRPFVQNEGQIHLKEARHALLVLREIEVIANDLTLERGKVGLVLSGPNAGGKTVALKTIGLCALLVRYGCFIPAAEGSRIDFFSVAALIGDQQTVHGDLSSFSAHLVSLKEILDDAGPSHLVLLDELASGTDPGQGAAFARAVLEELVSRGASVIATTHFAPLKGLARADERFEVAAVQYSTGHPTYRVLMGATGESHAFDIALRVGLPEELIERSKQLMGEGEAKLSSLLAELENERERAVSATAELQRIKATQAARVRELEEKQARINKQVKRLEEQGAKAFLKSLDQASKAVSQVVADLQRAPSAKGTRAARATLKALEALVPTPAPRAVEEATGGVFEPGDRVRIPRMNLNGEVVKVGSKVEVRAGSLTVRVKASELTRVGGAVPRKPVKLPEPSVRETVELCDAVRMKKNTLDLRGCGLDESLIEVERFVTGASQTGFSAVFLLHGHGTGVLKRGIRLWLAKEPGRWAPANAMQGGDAFTVVGVNG